MPERRGLPQRPFFYTVPQVAEMFSIEYRRFVNAYLWKMGEQVGVWRPRFLRSVKVAGEWRVGEAELLRWMKACGLYFYDPYLGDINLDPPVESDTPDPELLDL